MYHLSFLFLLCPNATMILISTNCVWCFSPSSLRCVRIRSGFRTNKQYWEELQEFQVQTPPTGWLELKIDSRILFGSRTSLFYRKKKLETPSINRFWVCLLAPEHLSLRERTYLDPHEKRASAVPNAAVESRLDL